MAISRGYFMSQSQAVGVYCSLATSLSAKVARFSRGKRGPVDSMNALHRCDRSRGDVLRMAAMTSHQKTRELPHTLVVTCGAK